jgi:hypothetical protein
MRKKIKRNRTEFFKNYKWFSKFSPVEKLKIAKRQLEFLKILKDAK